MPYDILTDAEIADRELRLRGKTFMTGDAAPFDMRAIATIKALRAALDEADEHVRELVDAWQRGCLSEHDGLGGTRSNRNHDLHVHIRKLLAEMKGLR